MSAWEKFKDFFMRDDGGELVYVDEVEDEVEEAQQVTHRTRRQKADVVVEEVRANGTTGTASYTSTATETNSAKVAMERLQKNTANPYVVRPRVKREQKVETIPQHKSQELDINVYAPKAFDDVRAIADDIRSLKATVVNYDNVDMDTQRRICDFMNGACYVLGGDARRISSNMVLYVPAGVNIGDACTDVSSMFSMR